MEENELEEGEAGIYKEEDSASIDPEITLSYIGEKLQDVLGHFQKDFEGGVSAENLGAKFGGYGSFLPTYQHSPSIWSHAKTPQRVQNYNRATSPNDLPIEGCSQNHMASSNGDPSVTLRNISCSAPSLHISGVPSGNISAKKDSLSALVTKRLPSKHETSKKSLNPTDQKVPKVRIKVGSINAEKKNAAIYSGLGLDDSPSLSLRNSPEESGGMLLESREALQESPTSILQIMISCAVPEGLLLSPLHDSLDCLLGKKKLPRNSSTHKSSQKHSAALSDEAASLLVDKEMLQEKQTTLVEKSEWQAEVKHRNGMDVENDMICLLKEKVGNESPEAKEHSSNDLKFASMSKMLHDVGDSNQGTGWQTVVSGEANKDGLKERLFISYLNKEESLESITGQDSATSEQQNVKSSSLEKIRECRVASAIKDVSADAREDGRCKGKKSSAQFRADSDMFKCKEDLDVGEMDPSQRMLGQKAVYEHDGIKIIKREKQWEGKKKLKGAQSKGGQAPHLAEEGLKIGLCAAAKGKHNLKPKKDIGKVQKNPRQLLREKKLKQMDYRLDSLGKPGERTNVCDSNDFEKGGSAFFKTKGSGRRVENPFTSEAALQVALTPPFTANRFTSGMGPAAMAPVVIEENWVCCDSCQKWRLLPYGTKPEQLPEKWLCSMLNWLPGLNRCDISEDETTKALNALYQLSIHESKSNLHNNVNGIASGVSLADVRHPGQNHQNLGFQDMPNCGKKKSGSKEMSNAGDCSGPISNSVKSHRQEPWKSRSLNDMQQLPSESNLMKKSSGQHFFTSHNLAAEKNMHKQKEKHRKKGNEEQTKTKSKREAGEYGGEACKKAKTEDVHSGKNYDSNHGRDLGRVCLSSDAVLPAKATRKEMMKSNQSCYSTDSKCDGTDWRLFSVKKLDDQAQVSLDDGPLSMKTRDKRDLALKKRKLKDWQDIQNQTDKFHTTKHHPQDNRVLVKEESSETEIRKEKKIKVITEGVESSTSKDDDRSRKGTAARVLLSGAEDHLVDNIEEIRSMEKDQQLKRYKEKIASQQTLDNVDSLKKDLGVGQASLAATSSSSKVSGSCKTRVNFQEVKGSSAESVSSSPLRTSNLNNLTAEKEDIFGKDDVTDGGLSRLDNQRRCFNGVVNIECNQSGTLRKEKISSVFPPKSLEFCSLDYQDGDATHKFSGKVKPSELGNNCLVKGGAVTLEQHSQYQNDLHAVEHYDNGKNKNHFCSNTLFPQKSSRVSSLQSKEKNLSSRSGFHSDKMKVGDPLNEQEDLYPRKSLSCKSVQAPHHLAPYPETVNDIKNKFPDKRCIKCNNEEKILVDKGNHSEKWSSGSKKENQLKIREYLKLADLCSVNGKATLQQNLIRDFEGEKLLNQSFAEKTDTKEESRGEKSIFFLHREGEHKTLAQGFQSVPDPQREGAIDGSADANVSKALKEPGNSGTKNGSQQGLSHLLPNQQRVRDQIISSLIKRDSSTHAASSALKEAKDLRDYADRLKSSGFGFESYETYFQAALKFLHGASLLETCNGEGGKNGVMAQIQAYGTAAKLCECCAQEYERRQEMAAASLAYKCMEVAYMRIVYCKHSSINRDRHELQATLQIASQGESPSSSALDIDNLNNQTMMDKAALPKGTGSHVGGKHIIVARNHPNFVRLLDFTQDVNFAMEASRKSQKAFVAANVFLEETQNREGITSVKGIIDLSFQDVEGFIHLLQLAQKAICHSGLGGGKD